MVEAAINRSCRACTDGETHVRSIESESHDCGNDAPNLLCRLGKVSVVGSRAMAPMAKQPPDLGQSLTGHDRLTCRRVPQVVQPPPADLRIRTNHPQRSIRVFGMRFPA